MARIQINGYASYEEWVKAGCPGAVSFDAKGNRKEPDPRRGLCRIEGCDNVTRGSGGSERLEICGRHMRAIELGLTA